VQMNLLLQQKNYMVKLKNFKLLFASLSCEETPEG
jgi:hypothetical protein